MAKKIALLVSKQFYCAAGLCLISFYQGKVSFCQAELCCHSENLKGLLDVAFPLLCRKRHKLLIMKSCLPISSDNLVQLPSRHLGLFHLSFSTFIK